MNAIEVLIVDDSAAARHALVDLLSEDPGIKVVGQAVDPFDAAQKMRHVLPDVIVLDIELPRMDGLTFLGKIMSQRPIPVVICSSHSEKGSVSAMKALELGACEVIGKPRLGSEKARQEAQIILSDAVRAAAQVGRRRGFGNPARATPLPKPAPFTPGPKLSADVILPAPRLGGIAPGDMAPIIAIGASTGGTDALSRLLPAIPPSAVPILVVQHMPEKFTAAFAARLDSLCQLRVTEARDGDRPEPGTVLIAPGDRHMLLRRQGKGYRVDIVDGPQVARHRPSVDVLFRSTAIAAGSRAFGILLTGMGDDGARGLLEMKQAGAETLVQDEASSVVWGMPGEAFKLGAAERTAPLAAIAGEVRRFSTRVAPR